MRFGAALTATAFGCSAGVFGTAGPASAATSTLTNTSTDSSVSLPFTGATAMLADTAAGHVFVAGGTSGSAVEVLNLAGRIVGSIANQQGVDGLALSPDGSTLYIADSSSFAITTVDASTLAQTGSYSTGVAAPTSLAVAGGKLWFTSSSDQYLHDVDLSTGVVATTTANTGYLNSLLAVSAAAPDTVVTGTPGLSPATVNVYDISSGTPAFTAGGWMGSVVSGGCANLDGMAITPDGKSLDLTCGAPYYGFQLPLSTMSTVQETYTTGAYADSLAVSPDGEVLIGTDFQPDSVYEFDPANSAAVTGFGTPTWGDAATKVAFGADDSVVYAVVSPVGGGSTTFHTFHEYKAASLSLNVPAFTHPNSTLTIGGTLTSNGVAVPGATVQVVMADNGVQTTVGTFTTDANGGYSFTAPGPALYDIQTYTATLAGTTPVVTVSSSTQTIPGAYPLSRSPVGPVGTKIVPAKTILRAVKLVH